MKEQLFYDFFYHIGRFHSDLLIVVKHKQNNTTNTYMFTKIISALAIMVICTNSITASASSYGTTATQYLSVFVADGLNKSYLIPNPSLNNPWKLAKELGYAIATQNGGFQCLSEIKKPKYLQVCGELVLSTDIPTTDDYRVDFKTDCFWSWKTWTTQCSNSLYINDIGNY